MSPKSATQNKIKSQPNSQRKHHDVQDDGKNNSGNQGSPIVKINFKSTTGDDDSDSDTLTCKLCKKEFTSDEDKLIECERCDHWVCLVCSQLSLDEYKVCAKEDSMIHWFCIDCNTAALTAVKTDNPIEEKCKQYFASFKSEIEGCIEEKVGDVRSELHAFKEEQQQRNVDLDDQIKAHTARVANDSVKEIREREERKLNVILFNVPESEEDSKKRIEEDMFYVHEICGVLEKEEHFSKAVRLGKKSGNIRPLRVTAKSANQVSQIL